MELQTRRAEPGDRSVVGELLGAVVAAAAGMRGGQAALELWPEGSPQDASTRERLIDSALSGDGPQVHLVRLEGVDVGLALLRLGHGGARIELAYVIEGARGIGAGDALLESLTEAARAAGATWLDAVALPGDRETKSLYERGGLVAREITLRRSLEA